MVGVLIIIVALLVELLFSEAPRVGKRPDDHSVSPLHRRTPPAPLGS